MDILEYSGQKIHVPTKWVDVTLGLYEAAISQPMETTREHIAVIATLCNVDPELLLSWPAEVFNELVSRTSFVFKKVDAAPIPRVVIQGTTFIINIADSLTLAEWVDADQAQRDGSDLISSVLAIVLRPAGEEYDPEKTEARQILFKDQPIEALRPLIAFFLHSNELLKRNTAAFTSLAQVASQLPKNIGILSSPGGFIKQFTTLRGVRLWIWTRRLRKQLASVSRS